MNTLAVVASSLSLSGFCVLPAFLKKPQSLILPLDPNTEVHCYINNTHSSSRSCHKEAVIKLICDEDGDLLRGEIGKVLFQITVVSVLVI